MNAKSMTASWQSPPSIVGRSADDRVAETGLDLRFGEPLGVRTQIEELERIRRAQVVVLLGERSRVRDLLDPLARPHAEVVPALRADAKRLRELVVAVVRATTRARVGMSLAASRLVRALALDLDVDSTLPGRHALDTSAGVSEASRGQHPRGERRVALRREKAGHADSRDPGLARDVAQKRFDLVSRRPVRLGDENIDLARVEHVEIERDVHGVRAGERAIDRVVDPRRVP